MGVDWQLLESRPADAQHTALLLPGGMCSARSCLELMQQPSLSGLRLVAATIPGHAGAPSPDDYSHEAYGRLTADLAAKTGADVVAGFSMGASVALERRRTSCSPGQPCCLASACRCPTSRRSSSMSYGCRTCSARCHWR